MATREPAPLVHNRKLLAALILAVSPTPPHLANKVRHWQHRHIGLGIDARSAHVQLTGGVNSDSAKGVVTAEVLPQSYFERLNYDKDTVPWDLLGRPQPPVRNAADAGDFGPAGTTILDCGCGAGDNANWLAPRGYRVVGFDISSSAIATACERKVAADVARAISAANGSVDFFKQSATNLQTAEQIQTLARELDGFPVVLDSALLHCLDDQAQDIYLNGIRQLTRLGGMLFVGCFSDANPDPWSNPRRISEERLRNLFSEEHGWQIVSLQSAWYERPASRTASQGGAWTMAWWVKVERIN